jgi:hypothetical protein
LALFVRVCQTRGARDTFNMPFVPSSTSASAFAPSLAMHSIGNQIGYKVRNVSHHGQPSIEIDLNNNEHGQRFVTSYSSMDSIEGTITITAPHDTRFEDIDIAFIGE